MQLTSFTDYGLRVLIYLATLEDGELTRIAEVTDIFSVSRNHMVKIVNRLGQLGYIETVRGKGGGMRLLRGAGEISVGEVVRDLEPMELVNCAPAFCHITSACRLKSKLSDAKRAFLAELDTCTIEDLVVENPLLWELVGRASG